MFSREVSVGEVSGRATIRQRTALRESVRVVSVHEEASVGGLYRCQFISETFSEELL